MADGSCSGSTPFKRIVDHANQDGSRHQDRLVDNTVNQGHHVSFTHALTVINDHPANSRTRPSGLLPSTLVNRTTSTHSWKATLLSPVVPMMPLADLPLTQLPSTMAIMPKSSQLLPTPLLLRLLV